MFTIISVVFLMVLAAVIMFKGGSMIKAYNQTTTQKVSPLIASGTGGVIFSVALIILGMNSWTIVDPGHNKVQVYLGEVQPTALAEGFSVVNPILDFVSFDLRKQLNGLKCQHRISSSL